MAYTRKTIDGKEIERQQAICADIFERVTADGERPLALVDTYGCQQNEADSEKLRGYLAEMGYGFTQDEFPNALSDVRNEHLLQGVVSLIQLP